MNSVPVPPSRTVESRKDRSDSGSDVADLGIVIVNYNVRDLLARCLESIINQDRGALSLHTVVVDNDSTDGSVSMVRQAYPGVTVIANADNVGYPAANNQGLRALRVEEDAGPRYVLLLNPDTELPAHALLESIAFMDANPEVGIMGPKLLLPDGSLDLACRRSFPTPAVSLYRFLGLSKLFPGSSRFARYNMTYLDEDSRAEVDAVVGAFMLLRRETVQQVGLLDERFWMYGEDLDWAKRIKDAGWKVIYNPDVQVLHVKRASSRQNKKRARREFFRAMPIFYYKHYRRSTPWYLHIITVLGMALLGGPALWPELWSGMEILDS